MKKSNYIPLHLRQQEKALEQLRQDIYQIFGNDNLEDNHEKLVNLLRRAKVEVWHFLGLYLEGEVVCISTTRGTLLTNRDLAEYHWAKRNVGNAPGRNETGHYVPPTAGHR